MSAQYSMGTFFEQECPHHPMAMHISLEAQPQPRAPNSQLSSDIMERGRLVRFLGAALYRGNNAACCSLNSRQRLPR